MGFLPPPPPEWGWTHAVTVELDDAQAKLWADIVRYSPWLCPYCHSTQTPERTDCRNCGAPKSALEGDGWFGAKFWGESRP